MSHQPAFATARDTKHFHICGRCPYFCRAEEGIHRCPWCKITLRRACDCGAPVTDPSDAECAQCGGWLRDPALRSFLRPARAASPHEPLPPQFDETAALSVELTRTIVKGQGR
jgi:hypothetical protein